MQKYVYYKNNLPSFKKLEKMCYFQTYEYVTINILAGSPDSAYYLAIVKKLPSLRKLENMCYFQTYEYVIINILAAPPDSAYYLVIVKTIYLHQENWKNVLFSNLRICNNQYSGCIP